MRLRTLYWFWYQLWRETIMGTFKFDPRTTEEVEKTRSDVNYKPDPNNKRAKHHQGGKPRAQQSEDTP